MFICCLKEKYKISIIKTEFLDSSAQSFWGRTFNQAISIFKTTQEETSSGLGQSQEAISSSSTSNINSTNGIALNAYLTYVSLPLTTMMQGIL